MINNSSQPSKAHAWIVVWAGFGINLTLGIIYSWSVFGKEFVEQLHWTRTEASIPFTVACLSWATFMIIGGRALNKYGPRVITAVSGVLAGLGMIIAGATQTVVGVSIGFGLVVGAAIAFGYSAPTPTAVKWFMPHKKGLITGIVVAGLGLSAVYGAPLTNYLIGKVGLTNAFYYEGALFLVVILLLSRFMAFPPQGFQPYGGAAPETKVAAMSASNVDYTPKQMLRTPQFYLLWIIFCFASTSGQMIIGHLATIAKIQGNISWGFYLVAVLAVANSAGRFISGWVSDRLGRMKTMFLFFSLQAVNMFAFINYTSPELLLVGVIITGLGYGPTATLFPSATFDYFGLKNGAYNYGILFSGWGFGALIGPVIGGLAVDLTGSYMVSYVVAGILLVIAVLLTLVTKPPKVQPGLTS